MKRVIPDLDAIPSQFGIDREEVTRNLNVRKGSMDCAIFTMIKVFKDLLGVHMAIITVPLFVPITWRLARLRVGSLVVAFGQPGRKGLVEPIEGKNLAGTHFRLELRLHGQKKAFNETARSRIACLAVNQPGRQGAAGPLQGLGVVDLGVVEVKLHT